MPKDEIGLYEMVIDLALHTSLSREDIGALPIDTFFDVYEIYCKSFSGMGSPLPIVAVKSEKWKEIDLKGSD